MTWSPFTGVVRGSKSEYWAVDGKIYDFKEWQHKHPGGAVWFRWNANRDITILLHCYHKNSKQLYDKLLPKFLCPDLTEDALNLGKPEHGAPPFLLPPGYEPRRDSPEFKWNDEGGFLTTLKKRVTTKEHLALVDKMDKLFDFVGFCLCVAFIGLHLLQQFSITPTILNVLLIASVRTGLGGWGHYYVHQKKPMLAEGLFDMSYVGTSLIAMDGHIAHHALTQTPMDPKRTFFYSMLALHPLLRPFGYTLHKLGLIVSGMFIRGFEINFFEADRGYFRYEFWFVRTVLLCELLLCWQTDQMTFWFAQFLLTLWFNTFMIVASHDFELPHYSGKEETDWGKFQLSVSFDFTVVGNRWVDLAFSAGLSPHRAHHMLPFQKTGFANLISEDIVKKTVKEFGLKWDRPRIFWTERLPALFKHYMLSPALDPRTRKNKNCSVFSPTSIIDLCKYVATGFLGVGAV